MRLICIFGKEISDFEVVNGAVKQLSKLDLTL